MAMWFVLCGIIVFAACKPFHRNDESSEIRESVVQRVYHDSYAYSGLHSVRLDDGKVLSTVLRKENVNDFFFLKQGDTVVYAGESVIEIRFKNDTQ